MSGPSKPHGGARPRGPLPRSVQISKKLSWLLRHGAEKENLALGPGGYADLAAVLANRNMRSLKVTMEEIRQIVTDNDKQRYSLILATSLPQGEGEDASSPEKVEGKPAAAESDNPNLWLIRATQGHSLKLQEEDPSSSLLTPITAGASNLPTTVVHGTTRAAWPRILASGGLRPMGRNHVHFASGLPKDFTTSSNSSLSTSSAAAATTTTNPNEEDSAAAGTLPVISGMRKTSTILIFLDLPRALEAGLRFGMSSNGVILTEGNTKGIVPVDFFAKVEDWREGKVLIENGVVVRGNA